MKAAPPHSTPMPLINAQVIDTNKVTPYYGEDDGSSVGGGFGRLTDNQSASYWHDRGFVLCTHHEDNDRFVLDVARAHGLLTR